MVKTKVVNFNLLFVCGDFQDGSPAYFPLSNLLNEIIDNYNAFPDYKIVKNYNFDPIRIKSITPPQENGYYHIIMERLDDTRLQKTTVFGESIDVDLDDNEYIGHEISVLYDPFNNTMLIQRNISSLSPSGIEKFFESVLFDYIGEYCNFTLVPAIDRNAYNKAENSNIFRQFAIKVKGNQVDDLIKGLSSNSINGAEHIEIIISTNKSKKEELDKDETKKLLNDWANDTCVEKLSVKVKENYESKIEEIDLIRQAIKRSLIYEYREAGELNAQNIFLDMVRIYRDDDNALSLMI
ncbi:DUF6731 family protein [Staphylococcus shinii]|jgi:hypothetical protein|uniref:DUF6731 family protein n=1 Tax=Staphylococcus shinii TaxID=2912228 RepID=UPI00298F3160|nr:DUF6731 family protein [Staphylococcus shinii]MDW8570542.1 DUF6731 family protein [Staphylococcus shinii]MDW8573554.1 DUF6731 family protein [Staphylococcus shinii]